jgi:hypothetical protein
MSRLKLKRPLIVSGAVGLLVGALAAGVAVGAGESNIYGTRVILKPEEPLFHGRVGSRRPRCERHRKVRIVRFSNRRVIGVTTSNRHGKWKLLRPNAHGRFRARVGQNRVIRPGLICSGGGRSPFIRFG